MRIVALGLAFLIASTPSFAQSNGPLPPGKPAGVKAAFSKTTENYILGGMVILGFAIGAVLADRAKAPSTSAATSTSP
jgi:hypothetical protein